MKDILNNDENRHEILIASSTLLHPYSRDAVYVE
jgi:hypothetical protein